MSLTSFHFSKELKSFSFFFLSTLRGPSLQLSAESLYPGCCLMFIQQPPLLDSTSSTSRTQTFVRLISSAGALSYFVSQAVGDVKRWKCCVAFYPPFVHFLLQTNSAFGLNALQPLDAEISLNMSSISISTNITAKAQP